MALPQSLLIHDSLIHLCKVSRISNDFCWNTARALFPCSLPFLFLCTHSLSCVWLCDPMDCSLPRSLSMGFSRQEYWRGLPFPPPGDLSDLGRKYTPLVSPALAGGFFTTMLPGKLFLFLVRIKKHLNLGCLDLYFRPSKSNCVTRYKLGKIYSSHSLK